MTYGIFDTLLDSVFVLDEQGCLIYGNMTASQLFDISQRRLGSRKPLTDFVQFADVDCFAPAVLAQIESPSSYKEMSFVCKSGKEGWGQVSIQPDHYEGQKQYVVYVRDVTLEQDLQRKYRAELEQKEGVIIDLQRAQAELENYSKNLEKMVEARTLELSEANRLLNAILNSLGQGFLVFDASGVCLPIYSRICQSILEVIPTGLAIEEVLRIPEHEVTDFRTWRTTLFEEPIPFEDLVALGPGLFPHSQKWRVELEFYPMRNEKKKIVGVVLVASNKTDEYEARLRAEREHHLVQMILKIIRGKRQFLTFLLEAKKLISHLQTEAEQKVLDPTALSYHLHTLKGGAGSFSLQGLHDLAHEAEDVLGVWTRAKDLAVKAEAEGQLRSHVANMQGEMDRFMTEYGVIVGPQVEEGPRRVEVPVSELLTCADLLPGDYRDRLRDFARDPIETAFDHYRDLVQDLALAQNKLLAPLEIESGHVRIYPEHYQEFFSSLIHVFRNSVDHGLETPDVREDAGKPAQGHLRVLCRLSPDRTRLRITIEEDGKGVDPSVVRRKLSERGINANGETDDQVIQHIFDDAFSTREEVSQLSGRGVGLAAVKQTVHQLGGTVRAYSVVGKGTRFEFDLLYFSEPFRHSSSESRAA